MAILMIVSDHYHTPVLLHDCINGLKINPSGIYVDVTFGGGGHSREILNHLKGGKLFAFDQDLDAKHNQISNEKFTLINANFRHLKSNLRLNRLRQVDGILADLGVSSHQLDVAERGFSFRFDGPLDMRMDKKSKKTGETVLHDLEFEELASMFRKYGEVSNAGKLASLIVREREQGRIETTTQLKEIALKCSNPRKHNQYLSKVFQALRIEVNDELKVLEEFLVQSSEVLRPGGRLVVMSYHSLEDRLVKRFLRSGNFDGVVEKDLFGNDLKPFRALSSKAIKASEKEIEENPRSRSARLRIGERINEQTKKGKEEI